ncbi:hypothetical protein [Streptosporangium sp. NPDC006007]|uniref:hypothetical protein n=1 Tax=Streptosporangium sp. NPDC006007 TaxID=3154575 RepID=UPI0033B0D148
MILFPLPPTAPPDAALHRPRTAAVAAAGRLQQALHHHGVHTSTAYDDGLPRLHIKNDLTIWTDPTGHTFFWSAHPGQRAEHAPATQIDHIAAHIAAHIANHLTTTGTPAKPEAAEAEADPAKAAETANPAETAN